MGKMERDFVLTNCAALWLWVDACVSQVLLRDRLSGGTSLVGYAPGLSRP